MRRITTTLCLLGLLGLTACPDKEPPKPTADQVEQKKQETLLQEASSQVDLPNITQFQEKRTMKMVEELADKAIPTYLYHFNPFKSCYYFIGASFGYPIPYATQYTNPQKLVSNHGYNGSWALIPITNADPNGLFKPASADGTWILMANPVTKTLEPQYIEDKVDAFTSRRTDECKVGG